MIDILLSLPQSAPYSSETQAHPPSPSVISKQESLIVEPLNFPLNEVFADLSQQIKAIWHRIWRYVSDERFVRCGTNITKQLSGAGRLDCSVFREHLRALGPRGLLFQKLNAGNTIRSVAHLPIRAIRACLLIAILSPWQSQN